MTNTSALSYQGNAEIKFTFNPTLSINISPSDLIIDNLTPGTTGTSNEISVNVSTNNVYGYSLYTTVGNSTNNSANLTHTNNAYTFTSISTAANLPSLTTDSTWGYTYSMDNGATWSNYNGLPLYSSTGARLKKTTELSEDTINFKIAAKSSPTQASGTYTNVINFTAITNLAPLSLAESYAAYYQKTGKTKLDGYYVMQDMNKEICDNAEIIDSELQVIDNRDHKVYWIAKLKDDHCWMTQNLDLDLTSNPNAENYIALTSENTDLTDTANAAYQDGYTVSDSGVITWVPERDTIAYNNLNSTTWQNDYNNPYSYDYLDTNGNLVYPDSKVSQAAAGNHGLSGNYYNWAASLASNDSISVNSANPNPINSICAKGWRLPNIANNEFGNLLVEYNVIETNTSKNYLDDGFNKMSIAPFYLVRGGRVYSGSISLFNNYSGYWSNTFYDKFTTHYFFFSSSSISPRGYDSRSVGWSVRCLAR